MEEVFDTVQKARLDHINLLVGATLEYVSHRFMEEGFDVARDECDTIMALVEETLKGALAISCGIYHPLADLAEEMFALSEELQDNDPPEEG